MAKLLLFFSCLQLSHSGDTAGNSEQDSTILPTQMAQSLSRIQLSFPLTELAI